MNVDKHRKTWRKRASRSIVTDRGASWYNNVFDIEPHEQVLDLGSGASSYSPSNVIRLDYIFAKKNHRNKGNDVAGLFQELPFRDEAFDRVVASWSFIKLREGAQEAVAESLRVLRPDGKLQIVPAHINGRAKASKFLDSHKATIENHKPSPKNQVIGSLICGALGGTLSITAMDIHPVSYEPIYFGASTALGVLTNLAMSRFGRKTLTVTRPDFAGDENGRKAFATELIDTFQFVGHYKPESIPQESQKMGTPLPNIDLN